MNIESQKALNYPILNTFHSFLSGKILSISCAGGKEKLLSTVDVKSAENSGYNFFTRVYPSLLVI